MKPNAVITLSLIVALSCLLPRLEANCDKRDFYTQSSRQNLQEELLEALVEESEVFPLLLKHQVTLRNETSRRNETLEGLEDVDEEGFANVGGKVKGSRCLKNVTKCMEQDDTYEVTLHRLTATLFSAIPPLSFDSKEISTSCRKQYHKYLEGLRRYKLWALKMYDSSAKIPSGFLNGNVNLLGDFDMCLGTKSDDSSVKGKYCLTSIQVEVPRSPYLAAIYNLMHAHSQLKSNLQDPGHRVPRFSSINWALCVPNQCSHRDVKEGLRNAVHSILNGTDVEAQMEVHEEMCQVKPERFEIPTSTVIVGCFFLIVVGITAASTLYDYNNTAEDRSDLLLSFSLIKNVKKMVSLERSPSDITAVHLIRLVNALLLLVAHKCMAIFFVPYINRTEMSEILGKPWTVLGRAASLYTDPFIMISGLLTAYSLFGKLQRNNRISIREEYLSRLIRIVPPLGALILFCTFILPFVNSGPYWNQVVDHHSHICKKYWWRNLLFIHNYFGFKEMCLTHTHHVGIDTQLFFLSPLAVLMVWKWPRRGLYVLGSLATVSTINRYYVTYTKQLSNYVHFGTSIEQLFSTADNMYILPSHRATVYIMGILLGYTLRNFKNTQLSSVQLHLGNIMAVLSFCAAFFGPSFMGDIDYVYHPTDAAWYAAFAPILWCFSFGWVIFITQLNQIGKIAQLINFKGFLITTRISYALYLTQFPIFFYNVGTIRSPQTYNFFSTTFALLEFGIIIVASVILTLLFETPFQNLKEAVMKRKSTNSKEVEKKVK